MVNIIGDKWLKGHRGKKSNIPRWIALLMVMLMASSLVFTGCESQNNGRDFNASNTEASSQNMEEVDKSQWNLILVNFAHKIDSDYQVETKELPGSALVDARIYDAAMKMLEDCAAEGYSPGVSSAYRDVQWQTELFNLEVQEHLDAGKSREEAIRLAKTEVAEPGTSEHHTGLAMDMIADGNVELEEDFEDTDVGKWLAKNAYRYGFILRYPKDKEEITGVIYEPWHFRYVGKKAAKEITEQGICLEEYLGIIDPVS